jgi:hypothetical protein
MDPAASSWNDLATSVSGLLAALQCEVNLSLWEEATQLGTSAGVAPSSHACGRAASLLHRLSTALVGSSSAASDLDFIAWQVINGVGSTHTLV